MLSWYNRFVFCFPAIAANLLYAFNDYTNYYYVEHLKMDTGILSTATAFNGAAVFLLSPIVAFLSDRKASKVGGERKTMLIVFALLYSLSQIPLIWIPMRLHEAEREAWVTLFTIISSILNAAFELNWAALAMTISHDFRERTLLYGMVNTVGSLAAVAGYAALAVLPLRMFVLAAIVLAAFNFVSYAWAASILGVRTSQLHPATAPAPADSAVPNGRRRSRLRVTLTPAGPNVITIGGGATTTIDTRAQRTPPAPIAATARERRTRSGAGGDAASADVISDADEPPNAHRSSGNGNSGGHSHHSQPQTSTSAGPTLRSLSPRSPTGSISNSPSTRYHEIKRAGDEHDTPIAPNRAIAHSALPPSAAAATATQQLTADGYATVAGSGDDEAIAGDASEDGTGHIPYGESAKRSAVATAAATAAVDGGGNDDAEVEEEEEDEEESEGDELPIVPTLIRTFRNYPFLILFVTQTLAYIDPLGPRSQLMKSYAFNAPQDVMALTSTMEMVVVAIATPFFVWMASKLGKKRVYMFLIISWAIVTLSLVLFVPDFHSPLYWLLELGTAIFGDTQTVFAQALLADVIDYDQLIWGGSKRAAIYSCVLSDGQGLDQVTDALQYGLMAAVGFHTSDDAAGPGVQRGFRLICFFSAVPSILAFIAFYRYPINRTKHREIVIAAKRRLRGGVTVIDPLTKLPLPKLEMRADRDHLMSHEYIVPQHLRPRAATVDSNASIAVRAPLPPPYGQKPAAAPPPQSVTPPLRSAPPPIGPVTIITVPAAPPTPATIIPSDHRHQSRLDFFSLWELRRYLKHGASSVRVAIVVHMMIWALIFGANIFGIVWLGIGFDLMSIFVSLAAIAIAFEYIHFTRYAQAESIADFSKSEVALHVEYVSQVLNEPLPVWVKSMHSSRDGSAPAAPPADPSPSLSSSEPLLQPSYKSDLLAIDRSSPDAGLAYADLRLPIGVVKPPHANGGGTQSTLSVDRNGSLAADWAADGRIVPRDSLLRSVSDSSAAGGVIARTAIPRAAAMGVPRESPSPPFSSSSDGTNSDTASPHTSPVPTPARPPTS